METLRTYLDRESARCIVGFALCWAWIDTVLVGLPFATSLAAHTVLGELAPMVSVLLCIIAYALCYRRPTLAWRANRRKTQWVVAAGAAAGTALVNLRLPSATGVAIIIGLVLVGIAMALIVLMWADDYHAAGAGRDYIWVAGSIALSFPLYLFTAELADWLRVVTVSALPLASCALLRSHGPKELASAERNPLWARSSAGGPKETVTVLGFSGSLAFWFFSFGFVFGIMQHFSPAGDLPSPVLMDFQQSGRAAAAVVFFIGLYAFSWKPHTAYRVSTVIVLGALVLLPMLGSNSTFAAGFIAHTAYGFFECMTWAIIFETMRCRHCSAGTAAGAARLLSALGLLAGTVLIILARDLFSANALQMQSILSSAVCLLVVSVMMVLGSDSDANVWAMMKAGARQRGPEDAASGPLVAATSRVGASCGLTEREIEILCLLAQGRTSPYISKELLIGVNTVNTHKRRIYQKLGVHNKQELIDLVRATAETIPDPEPAL